MIWYCISVNLGMYLFIYCSLSYIPVYGSAHVYNVICWSVNPSVYVVSAVDASFYCVSLFIPFHVQRKDLLQQMLDATQITGSQLEEGDVLIQSMGLLLAGQETTSSALSFTSYLLALNPEVQEKLAEEVVNYLQENPVSSKSVHVDSHEILWVYTIVQSLLQ